MKTQINTKNAVESMARLEGIPCFLWGKTGVGKSQLMQTLADKTGRELIYVSAAPLEGIDVNGLPEVVEGEAKFTLPVFFTGLDKNKRYLFFIDELNRSGMDVQQSLLNILNTTPYVGVHDVSEYDLWVVTANNDSDDQSGVKVDKLDEAMTTRGYHFNLTAKLKDVAEHLESKYGKTIFTAFMRSTYAEETIGSDFELIFNENRDEHVLPVARMLEYTVQLTQKWSLTDFEKDLWLLDGGIGKYVKGALIQFLEASKQIDPAKINSGKAKQAITERLSMSEYDSDAIITAFQRASGKVNSAKQAENWFKMADTLNGYPAIKKSVIDGKTENKYLTEYMTQNVDKYIDEIIGDSITDIDV